MVNCPRCGYEVAAPVKTWPISPSTPLKNNEKAKLAAVFECPSCKARFRSTVEQETKVQQTPNIRNMVGRIKVIKEELTQTLTNLREKIKTLETERANLMVEIENLRKVAESRVEALESEVSLLREEVKTLRDLLVYKEEE